MHLALAALASGLGAEEVEMMREEAVGINPRINCVFKAILGDPANADVLLDFLNAVLRPAVRFVGVEILNPQHSPLTLSGKETVLDVKATDAKRAVFQVEMQTWNMAALRGRVVFNNAEMFVRQGKQKMEYGSLLPAISVWLLEENLFRGADTFHHRFVLYDPDARQTLSEHLEIHTLELDRWRKGLRDGVQPEESGWMEFFSSAETWARIPDTIPKSLAMEKAMTTLRRFRDNEDWYRVYATQEDEARVKATLDAAYARAQAEKEQAEADRAQAEADRALAEAATAQAQAATAQAQAEKEQAQAATAQAQAEKEQAQAEKEQAQQKFIELEAALSREREASRAELEQLRAQLRRLQGD